MVLTLRTTWTRKVNKRLSAVPCTVMQEHTVGTSGPWQRTTKAAMITLSGGDNNVTTCTRAGRTKLLE